jgi:hypothetical protein
LRAFLRGVGVSQENTSRSSNARTSEMSARRVQQQSGSWAITGNMPVPSKGWTPFEIQEPWQDRRTLTPHSRTLSVLQSCAWFLCFRRPFFREPMKDEDNV